MVLYVPENPRDPEFEFELLRRVMENLGLENLFGEVLTVFPNFDQSGNQIPLTPIVVNHNLGIVPDDYHVIGDKTVGLRFDLTRPPTEQTVTFEFTQIIVAASVKVKIFPSNT